MQSCQPALHISLLNAEEELNIIQKLTEKSFIGWRDGNLYSTDLSFKFITVNLCL